MWFSKTLGVFFMSTLEKKLRFYHTPLTKTSKCIDIFLSFWQQWFRKTHIMVDIFRNETDISSPKQAMPIRLTFCVRLVLNIKISYNYEIVCISTWVKSDDFIILNLRKHYYKSYVFVAIINQDHGTYFQELSWIW